MTTHQQIKRRGQATAECFCELQEILDAAEPFANALDEAKQSLVEALNDESILEGEINLDDYKGEGSAFKFPEQGLNIVIQPRYALVLNPDVPEPKALTLAMIGLSISLPIKGHRSDGPIYPIWGRWRDGPEKRARGDLGAWKMLIGSF